MKYFLLFCFCSFSCLCFSQVDTLRPPYLRFPSVPPVQLLLGDSSTKFTKASIPKKTPVLVMLFSPDCSHCQHTAGEMLKYKEELRDITIIMATMKSISQMNDFVNTYKLNEMPNVIVGKDVYYILPPFYNIHNLPFMAFYNKKGNLISVFEGSLPLTKVIDIFKK